MADIEKIKREAQILSNSQKKRNKFLRLVKILFFIFLIIFVISSTFSYKIIFSQDSVLKGLGQLPVIKQIRKIVGLEGVVKGELDDRINFLILGQGGEGHDGPYLTDTIIFGSIKPSSGQVVLLSIPRDFLIEVEGYGWYKINAVNSFGETENYPGGGSALVAKTIESLFNLDVHYWLRMDFDAFQQIIDQVGGIEICVDQAFTDELYPADNYQYQTVSFATGCQIMDGQTALIYSRSRHGNNGQGSDFARSRRQQQIILSLKDKIFNWKTVFNPNLIYSLFDIADKNIQTNVKKNEIVHFIDLAKKIVDSEVKKRSLDNSPEGLLQDKITADGAYVLVPRAGDYSEIRNLVKNIFVIAEQPQNMTEQVKLAILNGTQVEGLARDTAGFLSSLSYQIVSSTNAPRQDYEKTVIYDLSDGSKKEALKIIKQYFDANISNELPEFLNQETQNNSSDFIVVLGCNIAEQQCEQAKLEAEQRKKEEEVEE